LDLVNDDDWAAADTLIPESKEEGVAMEKGREENRESTSNASASL
jgi:hypothetical protein